MVSAMVGEGKTQTIEDGRLSCPSSLELSCAHLICTLGIGIALCVAHICYSIDLISDPCFTLRILWVSQCPSVMFVYSWFRLRPEQCSFLRAAGRGAMIFPLGTLVNGLGAIALGAPVGIQFLWKTIHWSAFLSSLTFVPAACTVGLSWKDWQRLLSCEKSNVVLYNLVCIPAHGAIIGAWFGAWPMPLDWERPWQEWPICVTYGAIAGYIASFLLSFAITVLGKRKHAKKE